MSVMMDTQLVDIKTLTADPANVRRHGERNLETIKGSLKRFGQQKPIVVGAKGVVIAGNGTLEAARALGWEKIAVVRSKLKGAEGTAYSIADNRTSELAEWDDGELAEVLAALQKDESIDELVTGFSAEEIDQLIAEACGLGEVVEDEVPEVSEGEPVTKPGDLWTLGVHRLLCGDSTKGEDVGKLLDGREPFIMVTDPPYGVEYDTAWRDETVKKTGKLAGIRAAATGAVTNDERKDWTDSYVHFPGHVAYVWHAGRFAADLVVNLRDAGFDVRTQIIWRKPQFVVGRGHYHWQHEPAWYAVRKGGSAKWCGDRTQSTIWEISGMAPFGRSADVSDKCSGHGTQKPVECMARPIRNHGGKGDDVYDPFLGSGTTLIAAEQLGRKCYGIEIEPRYVDVICKRWMKLTGRYAVRESDGLEFPAEVPNDE